MIRIAIIAFTIVDRGITVWPFIFPRRETGDRSKPRVIHLHHEMIHATQQFWYVGGAGTLVWILQASWWWLLAGWAAYGALYFGWYLVARVRGLSHDQAYFSIPFERECFENESSNPHYLPYRWPFAEFRYVRQLR